MRFSQQRETILKMIQGVTTHPTAYDVHQMVQEYIPNISMGTVYRNLAQLIENNLLISLEVNKVVRFDANIQEHQHFICSTCNLLADIDISIINSVDKIDKEIDHKINGYQLLLNGICNECDQINSKIES
jgi:Fe2+ or Zn2+ uptake regulation protein